MSKLFNVSCIVFSLLSTTQVFGSDNAWSKSKENPLGTKATSSPVMITNPSEYTLMIMTDDGSIISGTKCYGGQRKNLAIKINDYKVKYFRLCNPILATYSYHPLNDDEGEKVIKQLKTSKEVVVQGITRKSFIVSTNGYQESIK